MARHFLAWIGLGIAATLAATPALAQSTSAGGKDPSIPEDSSGPTPAPPPAVPPPAPPPPPIAPGVTGGARDAANDFQDWAVAVVAADWRSGQGQPIRAFENSRRDLAAAFERAGFARRNIAALSLAPNPDGSMLGPQQAAASIEAITRRATAGCLLYFTSHGSPAGIVWGPNGLMSPATMDRLIDGWCGTRPTVVVVSACYSGVFVPALARSNRMIMSAARRDRSSFGCSEDATHPYFDACVLEALNGAADFLALSLRTTGCVNRREREEGLRPPSEPQTYVGAQMQPLLPFLQFARP